MRFSIGGWVAKIVCRAPLTPVGTMKKAFISPAARRSCWGTRFI